MKNVNSETRMPRGGISKSVGTLESPYVAYPFGPDGFEIGNNTFARDIGPKCWHAIQVHEDNDILGRFSPEEYTWINPAKGVAQVGMFIAGMFGLCGVIYMWYPDKPAVPRTFPHNGLEVALGGKNALPVSLQHN